MQITKGDIKDLVALRDTLIRMTERAKQSYGMTFDDEILTLNHVIGELSLHLSKTP